MQLIPREINGVSIVEVETPWLDGPRAQSLFDNLAPLLAGRKSLILDLSPVRYLDLFAFDALLAALRLTEGAFAICCPDPGVASLFVTSLPEGTVTLCPDLDTALLEVAPKSDEEAVLKS